MNEREFEHLIETLRDINRNIEKVADQIEKLRD
jgi:hypothetical protein